MGEYCKIRNALNVILRSEFGELLGVNLEHDGASREFARHLGNMGSRHPARAAPRSPEIHQDWNFAVPHNVVELRGANSHGLCYRRQGSLAGAAPSSVGKVLRRDSIRFCARRTISNDGHGNFLLECALDWIPLKR